MTDIPRPYAHMQADELADEITVCRECIQTTRDLRLRKQMQAKLAELIAEENRRFTEGLPFYASTLRRAGQPADCFRPISSGAPT